jgi:hypothetical protein
LVSAEQMEGRRLVKGNARACSMSRTQCRTRPASGTNLRTIGIHANRHHLRQEPDALVALVRICGGGVQQCASLLRLGRAGYFASIEVSPNGGDDAAARIPLSIAG